jgi:hypothetical protein
MGTFCVFPSRVRVQGSGDSSGLSPDSAARDAALLDSSNNSRLIVNIIADLFWFIFKLLYLGIIVIHMA